LREGAELPGATRDDGAVWSVERARGAVRPAGAQPQRVAVSHQANSGALHRHAGRVGGARRGGAGLGAAGQGGAPDRARVSTRGGGGGPPPARGAEDDGEGAADSVKSLASYHPGESRGVGREPRKHRRQIRSAEVAGENLAEQVAEVRRHREVAPLEAARRVETRPAPEHTPAV